MSSVAALKDLGKCRSTFRDLAHSQTKPQARLTEAQAVEVFKHKSRQRSATSVSKIFGVNEKTVRDIWSGRTWSHETWHLDTSRIMPLKKMGRPKGRVDTKPRKSKAIPIQIEVKNAQTTTLELLGISKISQRMLLSPLSAPIDELLYQWEQQGSWIVGVVDKQQLSPSFCTLDWSFAPSFL